MKNGIYHLLDGTTALRVEVLPENQSNWQGQFFVRVKYEGGASEFEVCRRDLYELPHQAADVIAEVENAIAAGERLIVRLRNLKPKQN